MALGTRVDLNIGATLQNALDLSSEARVALTLAKAFVLSSGTSSGQNDRLWFDKRNILASNNDDLDLAGGLTLDTQPVSFAKVKGMFIFSLPTNVNTIVVGNGPNPFIGWVGAAAHTINVLPGGCHFLIAPGAGYTVTPSTGDTLRLANSAGNAVDYEIVLFGTSV